MKPYNIKGTAHALYLVHVERAQYGQYCPYNIGHKAHYRALIRSLRFLKSKAHEEASICLDTVQTSKQNGCHTEAFKSTKVSILF